MPKAHYAKERRILQLQNAVEAGAKVAFVVGNVFQFGPAMTL
jgi:hypothetical protein